jgi:hypothetical protein
MFNLLHLVNVDLLKDERKKVDAFASGKYDHFCTSFASECGQDSVAGGFSGMLVE